MYLLAWIQHCVDDTVSTKLISLTPDAETLILFCARVSSNQENTAPGLLKYLIKNNHWSPFEMAHAVFEINTSRAIAQQILRHRSFAFQEFSQRYSGEVPETVVYDGRKKAEQNRQSSVEGLNEENQKWFRGSQEYVSALARNRFAEALERGIATESARFLLPSGTGTKLYMAGSLRSWIHYFDVRCDEHTQEEHRVLALAMRAELMRELPVIKEALESRWKIEVS